jgi:hypothetical protein
MFTVTLINLGSLLELVDDIEASRSFRVGFGCMRWRLNVPARPAPHDAHGRSSRAEHRRGDDHDRIGQRT